jgi:tRNA (guanine37-N1)-methyltransferase
MRFDIVTIFPEFFAGPLDYGILRRAREAGIVDVRVHDLRQFAHDRHKTVDDRPFGGGEGMLLKPEPLFEAVESVLGRRVGSAADTAPRDEGTAIVLLSASGKIFRQEDARRFAKVGHVILLCGRYEGVDERVAEHLATDELSIGDFVLSGGELAAALVLDSVTRLLPGALGNEASSENESFSALAGEAGASARGAASENEMRAETSHGAMLDCPHYTRPAEFRGWRVPDVLIGGNHEQIRRWRHEAALAKTRRNRPDLRSA